MPALYTKSGQHHDLDEERILANDPILPGERHPHRMRLWVIGNEYGPIVALWATCEQDALDEMLDRGYEQFLVQPEDVDPDRDDYTYLGNAGEPCDLTCAWIEEVDLQRERDFALCIAFAEARGAGNDTI